MSTLQEIEAAVSRPKPEELAAFRVWCTAFDAKAWDIEFEQDVAAGRLDKLAEEALKDMRRTLPLQVPRFLRIVPKTGDHTGCF